MTLTIRKRKEESEYEEARFERDMFIANPTLYNEYKKKQQEDIDNGNYGVVWTAPETIEEIHAMDKIFADIDKKIKSEDSDEAAANEEFIKQMDLMGYLNNIDVDKIGDE